MEVRAAYVALLMSLVLLSRHTHTSFK